MCTPIGRDTNYLLYKLGIIDRFADLKAVFFPNDLIRSISLAINTGTIRFLDKNVATNNYLSVSRPSI